MSRINPKEIKIKLDEALEEKSIPNEGRLADMAGLGRTTVNYIFKHGGGRVATLSKLQDVLNPINLEWILDGRPPKYLDGREEPPASVAVSPDAITVAPAPPHVHSVPIDLAALKQLIREAIREEMPNENTHKLTIAYLEEILYLLRGMKTQPAQHVPRAAETGPPSDYGQGPPLDHGFPPTGGKK